MTLTHWCCVAYREPWHPIPCTAGGTYRAANSGGPAEKHTRTTGHPTLSRLALKEAA